MAVIDWIIVGILAISTLISLKRGFVREALSLVTWIAAVIVARIFANPLSDLLAPYIESSSIRLVVAYVLLIIGTLMAGGMIGYLIGEFVKITGLAGLDQLLGMFFGLARGVLIVVLLIALLRYVLPVEEEDWYQQSRLIPLAVEWIERFGPVVWEQGAEFFESKQPITPGQQT